jgi:hypothetical protein
VATAAGTGLASITVPSRAFAVPRASRFYIGGRAGEAGRYFATAFDEDGATLCDLALPGRGHGFAKRPDSHEIVAFARRPGDFAVVFDPRDTSRQRLVEAAEGRKFCGHGLFARGGALLVTTELEYETGDGVLGLYDATNGYRRVGEWRSGGLDPHEALLLQDGKTLVVANGGILTDPDAPGVKLNRDSMESSLAYIDVGDGRLVDVLRLPAEYAQLSLRHMSLSRGGLVAVAMQYEGPSSDLVPLVVTHRPGDKTLETLPAPDRALGRLRNYCGSVAFDGSDRVLAVTSPVGGVVGLWDMAGDGGERRFLGVAEKGDVCGLAAAEHVGAFIVTSGLGGAGHVAVADPAFHGFSTPLLAAGKWDNHLLRVA